MEQHQENGIGNDGNHIEYLYIYIIYTHNNSNNNDNDDDNNKKNGHVPFARPATALWKFDTAMEHQKYLGKSDVQTYANIHGIHGLFQIKYQRFDT